MSVRKTNRPLGQSKKAMRKQATLMRLQPPPAPVVRRRFLSRLTGR